MVIECRRAAVRPCAALTLVGSFVCVGHHVALQVRLLVERRRADGARVGSLVCVDAHMHLEVVAACKCARTVVAHKRSFPRVRELVLLHGSHLRRGEAAHVAVDCAATYKHGERLCLLVTHGRTGLCLGRQWLLQFISKYRASLPLYDPLYTIIVWSASPCLLVFLSWSS